MAERLVDAQRPEREHVVGGDEGGGDGVAGEPAERDHRLEPGDAGPRDEDAERAVVRIQR
jgi:hypothetical protein